MRIDAAKLKRERERRALSLRDLADLAGVSSVTVWRIENEETGPARPSTVRKLATALDLAPEALIAWDQGAGEGKAAA